MDEVEAVTTTNRPETHYADDREITDRPRDDWVARLSASGAVRDDATRSLHALMVRAARHQVAQMSDGRALGQVRLDEIVQGAADEATMAVLSRLGTFEGRSRFTTWAYKFGILHAAVELRRSVWKHREIDLNAIADRASDVLAPEAFVVATDFVAAVQAHIETSLTAHQRRVLMALVVEGIPIDVLAERLGTNRNALYKTLHDARNRLRAALTASGYLGVHEPEDETS